MRFRLLIIFTLFSMLFLSACSSLDIYTNTPELPASQTPTQPNTKVTPSDSVTTQPATERPGTLPKQFQPAQSHLAETLGISESEIKLKSSKSVMWRDSCLGVSNPNEMCAQVITPGYQVIFSTPKGEVEVHTNESGSTYRVASPVGQPPQEAQPAIVWQRTGGIAGICHTLTVYKNGSFQMEDCKGNFLMASGKLLPNQINQLNNLLKRYKQYQWESKPPAGSADMFTDRYTFYGEGDQIPSPEDQKKIDQLLSQVEGMLDVSTPGTESSGSSGIQGQALLGPTCPGPVRSDTATQCADKPYQATFTVLDQAKNPVVQFQTDAQGHFQISLPPGTYTLHPEVSGPFPRAADQTVTVMKGQFTDLQINFDSGIR